MLSDEVEPPAPKELRGEPGIDDHPLRARALPTGEIYIAGVKLKNTQFSFPVSINSRVEYWVDYFTHRGRPYFQKYLDRSEYFIPYIIPLLKQHQLPEDLVYLAMIESGFNTRARSHALAVGPWQFISSTGKRYGLAVNWWIDERRDIGKSTVAAGEFLRDLYGMFQSWELAAAAYNAGEAKIARAIRQYSTRDFWTLSRQQFLRPETRDYVPKIIAAALIAKNRTQFGFSQLKLQTGPGEAVAGDGEVVPLVKTDRPLDDLRNEKAGEVRAEEAEILEAQGASTLHELLENDLPEMRASPALTASSGAPPRSNGRALDTLNEERLKPGNSEDVPMARPITTPHVTTSGIVGGEELADFEIQSPADLFQIARAAGLSYPTVKNLNPEILRWCTPPNVRFTRIKLPVSASERFLAKYNERDFPRRVHFMTYHARKGETLTRIARHFGIHVDPMRDLNRLGPRALLPRGTAVLLPLPKDQTRSIALLEVRDPPQKKKKFARRRHPLRS